MTKKVKLSINPNTDENAQRTFRQIQQQLNELLELIEDAGGSVSVANLGTGAQVYKETVADVVKLRSITGSGSVTVTEGANAIDISAPSAGEVNTASNVGAGAGVFKAKVLADLQMRSLIGTGVISVTQNTNDVTITSTAEANTSSNAGAGAGLAKAKSGVDLPFKSLVAGANVTITPNTDDVTIAAALTDLTTIGVTLLSTGADGALDFDGSSTVLGIAPGANANFPSYGTQVYSLTRDIHPTTIRVRSGVLLHVNGYRVMATGLFTLEGDIGSPGGAGANATAGAGGAGGAGTSAVVLSGRNAGGNGGAAAGGNSAQAPRDFLSGVNTGGASPGATAGQNGSGLGRGGGGGGANAGVTVGFSGGTVTNAAASEGTLDNLLQAVTTREISTPTNRFTTGTGGGGGANGGGVKFGGGGGGSGGIVVVTAKSFTGSGNVTAAGGAGGLGNGGGGSGGGGAGGIIILVNCTGSYPTTVVTGGAGGAATAGGGAGGNGGDGVVKKFKVGA